MASKPKLKRHEAEQEAEEVRSWQCQSCETMIEDGGDSRYCRHCKAYGDDVAAGVFDRWDDAAAGIVHWKDY